jgi:hypothetical protein
VKAELEEGKYEDWGRENNTMSTGPGEGDNKD